MPAPHRTDRVLRAARLGGEEAEEEVGRQEKEEERRRVRGQVARAAGALAAETKPKLSNNGKKTWNDAFPTWLKNLQVARF